MIERFAQMPAALRDNARWERLGASRIPALLVHPEWGRAELAPVVIWMHGRTANKELDPGRYLRWMRAGIGACAVDLPGHGERFESECQDGSRTPWILRRMVDEIDEIIAALTENTGFDRDRMALGGISAGGMAALARLCNPHPFRCASVEATTGALDRHFKRKVEFTDVADGADMEMKPASSANSSDLYRALNPIAHLGTWREIPFQAFHSRGDQMISFEDQAAFIEALRAHYRDPTMIDFIDYEGTGAPSEHIGFGRFSAAAKDRQRDFFMKHLITLPFAA